MKKGTRVKAFSDGTVHNLIRGREGVVVDVAYNGGVAVLFDGDTMPRTVDRTALEIVQPPPPPPPPPEDKPPE